MGSCIHVIVSVQSKGKEKKVYTTNEHLPWLVCRPMDRSFRHVTDPPKLHPPFPFLQLKNSTQPVVGDFINVYMFTVHHSHGSWQTGACPPCAPSPPTCQPGVSSQNRIAFTLVTTSPFALTLHLQHSHHALHTRQLSSTTLQRYLPTSNPLFASPANPVTVCACVYVHVLYRLYTRRCIVILLSLRQPCLKLSSLSWETSFVDATFFFFFKNQSTWFVLLCIGTSCVCPAITVLNRACCSQVVAVLHASCVLACPRA